MYFLRIIMKSLPPEGFTQGVMFSKEQIDAALQSTAPLQLVPSVDISGHGTAVATIAAGSGNFMDGRFQGVAPEAELLIVKLGNSRPNSFPKTTELMRGLTFAARTALQLSMPLVINLSFGNTYGVHDGTSLVERFLDNIAELGRCVICVGSGNEGAAGGHAAGTFNRDAQGNIPRTELAVGEYQASFSVQLWKEYTDTFRIALQSPGGQILQLNSALGTAVRYRMEDTELLIYQGEPTPYSVRQEIYFDFLPVNSYVNQGVWSFMIEPVQVEGGVYDFYLPSSSVLSVETRFFQSTPEKTLTIPSTAARVITVGAYDTYTEAYADFSGRGSRMLPYLKPDLVAPGVNIVAPVPGGGYRIVTGTSFAAPFVSGSAALLMQWGIVNGNDPYLYGEKVKAYLRKGARPLPGYEEYPNEEVGWGEDVIIRLH